MTTFKVIPDPALNEAAWRIVRRRFAGDLYEEEYRAAFARLHRLVPLSAREAQAAEDVIEAEVKRLADMLEGTLQDYLSEEDYFHDKVGFTQQVTDLNRTAADRYEVGRTYWRRA